MGCFSSIGKYLLFLMNLIFALAGLALLVVGILYKLNLNHLGDTIDSNLGLAPTLLIVVGSIVFIIAFFGCCGAVRESTCMLTTYAVILLTIFILQIAVGVFAFLQIKDEDQLKSEMKQGIEKTFNRYESDNIARETVDLIQSNFKCCGFESSSSMLRPNSTLPDTCCEENKSPCYPKDESVYNQSCWGVVSDAVISAVKVIGIVAVSIAALEIVGAIFALCLSSSIRNQERRGAYA